MDNPVTYGELYQWLAAGNGAYSITNCPHVLFSSVFCAEDKAPVEDGRFIEALSWTHYGNDSILEG